MSMRTAETTDYAADVAATNGYADGGESVSVIDRYSNFDGTFRANRDLRIDGEVKGTIECQGTLFVAQGANVNAKIEAENITVAGDLNGDIRCRGRLQLMPSGRVRGKVSTDSLVINEGAFYEGQLEMTAAAERTGLLGGGKGAPRALSGGATAPVALPGADRGARPGGGDATANGSTSSTPNNTFIRRFGGPETPWENRPEDPERTPEGSGES